MKAKNMGIFSAIFASVFLFTSSVFGAWDFSKHNIPLNEIRDGGPPKDGIPALTNASFVSAPEATFLNSSDRVLGFFQNGEAKAYPLRILNWHEIVNDFVGSRPVVITYCPLTGSGVAYEAEIDKKRVIFGVSGKLYNSNVLFYDRDSESLWSQLKMEAVAGKMTGTKLKLLPLINTTWQDWTRHYPATKVLSHKTGYKRDYKRDPYQSYQTSNGLMFPVSPISRKLSDKEWVLGVVINGEAKAYPFKVLEKVYIPPNLHMPDKVGGENIIIYFDKNNKSAWCESQDGKVIPSVQVYWFAWYAFYPDTALHLHDLQK